MRVFMYIFALMRSINVPDIKCLAVRMSPKSLKRSEPDVSLSSVLEFIKTLNAKDLEIVQDAVRAQKKTLPMILEIPSSITELLKGKLEVFDEGSGEATLCPSDVYAESGHTFLLKWTNDGEELKIEIGNQEGVMGAGTQLYEVQYIVIGPLTVVASFPDYGRLPRFVSGIKEFMPLMKKRGINSEKHVMEFVEWVIETVAFGERNIYLTRPLDSLFDELEEDDEDKGKEEK